MSKTTAAAVCLIFSVGFTAPAASTADPSSPPPGGSSVTLADLLSTPVPALCQHDPGNLVNGILPPQDSHRGPVMIAKRNDQPGTPYKIAFGGLTGGDNVDAAMVTDCGAGGMPWSDTVQLYTAGPTRLGGVDLGDITHSREVVTDLSISTASRTSPGWPTHPVTPSAVPRLLWPAICVGTV